jgi:ribosomal protein S18 acetylase RimI-like enzyme
MATARQMELLLRQATAEDLPAMARVHRRAYSRDHFMALLPEAALADYYARFLGDGAQALLAVGHTGQADEVLGFAVFGRNIEPRIAAFKRDQRAIIAAVALRHPLLAARRTLVSLAGRRRGGTHAPAPALLLSIAVARTGGGVGRALLDEMVRRSRQLGESRIGLYVRHGNISAINAYLRTGFRIVQSISDQYYMEHDLSDGETMRNG